MEKTLKLTDREADLLKYCFIHSEHVFDAVMANEAKRTKYQEELITILEKLNSIIS